MSDVTNDDTRQAYALIGQWDADDSGTYLDLARIIAAALAEERERARAPFLALAEEIEAACAGRIDVVSMTMRDDAALIRATLDDNR